MDMPLKADENGNVRKEFCVAILVLMDMPLKEQKSDISQEIVNGVVILVLMDMPLKGFDRY